MFTYPCDSLFIPISSQIERTECRCVKWNMCVRWLCTCVCVYVQDRIFDQIHLVYSQSDVLMHVPEHAYLP